MDIFDLINVAYLDPGTGSLIIQSVIGVVAGITVFGRNAIHQLAGKTKRFFTKNNNKPEANTEQQ